MLTHLGTLHAIAARRGDGLRPELANLIGCGADALRTASGEMKMSREQENKVVVGRWFEGFWGNPWNPRIIDDLAATFAADPERIARDVGALLADLCAKRMVEL